MATEKRMYLVEIGDGREQRLVKAGHPSRAIAHVASKMITARVPTQDELFAAAAKGVKVEEAGE